MDHIIQGVRHFHKHVFARQKELFEKLAREQKPRALFIACSDSRVHPNLITQTGPGDLFILRNPGNIVPPYSSRNDSESATIEYAVAVLKVSDIIVCGHSNCGAMSALLRHDTLQDLPAVSGWLHHAESTRRIVAPNENGNGNCKIDEPMVDAAVECNALIQLDNLRTHPVVAVGLANNDVHLHAWVYDIASGDVRAYDNDQKRFISLNGDSTDAAHPAPVLEPELGRI